jgi:hypothetical protein
MSQIPVRVQQGCIDGGADRAFGEQANNELV